MYVKVVRAIETEKELDKGQKWASWTDNMRLLVVLAAIMTSSAHCTYLNVHTYVPRQPG